MRPKPNAHEAAPITPDHVIRTKRVAAVVAAGDAEPSAGIEAFAADYAAYFERNGSDSLAMLDPAPRWAVWEGKGTLAFETSVKGVGIVSDLVGHTTKAIQWGESLGGWQALPEKDLFEMARKWSHQSMFKTPGVISASEGQADDSNGTPHVRLLGLISNLKAK